jgi:hypothetical protein
MAAGMFLPPLVVSYYIFKLKQIFFPFKPTGITGKLSTAAHDSVAGDENGYGVS